ncbi:hypothetical protein D0T56_08230 [Dysgonomonas sp. 520]|nr:hypothetical protein [Dysgonomonas sp. 520]
MACSVNTFAQGFASFDVEGSLFKSSIKNIKTGPSKVEVIVGNDVDLKNVKFKYKLLSACRLEDKIDKNFTSPQKVEISKNATSKDWTILVKKLQPATLPLDISFSNDDPSIYNSSTKGWVTFNTDEGKPQVVRFGNSDVSFLVAFDGEAKDVSYDLKVVGAKGTEFDGKFEVSASPDGKNWNTIVTYDSKTPFSTDNSFTNELESDVRFVKWTYVTREKQNVNLNNIIVSPK